MNATATAQLREGYHIAEESNEGDCKEDIDLSTLDPLTTQRHARVIPPDIDVHVHEQLSFTITVRLHECRLQRERRQQVQDASGAYPDRQYQMTTISSLPSLPQHS